MSERIEGVPVGTKLVRIGAPKLGDWLIGPSSGKAMQADHDFSLATFIGIIVPDNVYNVIDLSTVKTFEDGWEDDENSFRSVDNTKNEFYISPITFAVVSSKTFLGGACGPDIRRKHVRKIQPKIRRVLVAEWPIGADGRVEGWFTPAINFVSESPLIYRIEERPL